jgi:hypothetical protein
VDEPESLQLSELYTTIERVISERVPGLAFVTFWPEGAPSIPLPAVLLEMPEFEPGTDDGTGRTALVARFEARVVVGAEQDEPEKQACHIASQLAVLLRSQYWRLNGVDAAELVQAAQDWTKPELDGYIVWVVEWTQPIKLGEEEWPWPDNPPATLQLGVTEEALDLSGLFP